MAGGVLEWMVMCGGRVVRAVRWWQAASSPRRNADSAGRVARGERAWVHRAGRGPVRGPAGGFSRGPAHPAVVAHPHEALGQHMGEPTFEEAIHRQGDDVRAVGAALVAEQADVA